MDTAPPTLDQPASALKSVPVERGRRAVRYVNFFYEDVLALTRRIEERHGRVYSIGAPLFQGAKMTFLLGPDAVEYVLHDSESNFSSQLGWDYFIGRVFPGAIMAMDGEPHRRQRRIMASAFNKTALRGYVNLMAPHIAEGVRGWGEATDFRVFNAVKRLTLGIAARTFMAVDFGGEAEKIDRAFIDCVEASIARIRWAIPPFRMWRGVQGRAYLEKKFRSALPEKRANETDDLFSRLCRARSEEGDLFTDEEIVNHMIFLMMAAHDTSTSAITTMVYLLAKHPEWRARCRESALAVGTDAPDYDGLNEMEDLSRVMKEALRIYPPLACMPRRAVRDCAFEGWRIEEGDLVGVFPIHTHHMESLWSQPFAFDPDRFSPERREEKSHRCAWTPFGGGAHLCIGRYFGELEIKLVLHHLLINYDWTVPEDYALPYQLVPIAKAKDGAPVRLQRLT